MKPVVFFATADISDPQTYHTIQKHFDSRVLSAMQNYGTVPRNEKLLFEEAAKLQALVETDTEVWVTSNVKQYDGDVTLQNLHSGEIVNLDNLDISDYIVYGNPGQKLLSQISTHTNNPDTPISPLAKALSNNTSIHNELLLDNNHTFHTDVMLRPIWRAGIMDPEYDHGQDLRTMLWLLPYNIFFVKNILAEKTQSPFQVDVTDCTTPKTVDEALNDAGFWDTYPMHLEGREAWAVTPWLNLTNEWRYYVIGGKPVSAAKHDEAEVPDLDKQTPIEYSPFLYRMFAHEIIKRQSDRGIFDYTLDIALDIDTGKPIVVEIQGILQSGLFANNPRQIVSALVQDSDDDEN